MTAHPTPPSDAGTSERETVGSTASCIDPHCTACHPAAPAAEGPRVVSGRCSAVATDSEGDEQRCRYQLGAHNIYQHASRSGLFWPIEGACPNDTTGHGCVRPTCPRCAPAAALPGAEAGTPTSLDFPAAARSIALNLADFCDETLPYPTMIADAARKAADRLAALTSEAADWKRAAELQRAYFTGAEAENARLTSEVRALTEQLRVKEESRQDIIEARNLALSEIRREQAQLKIVADSLDYHLAENLRLRAENTRLTESLAARLASPSPTGAPASTPSETADA